MSFFYLDYAIGTSLPFPVFYIRLTLMLCGLASQYVDGEIRIGQGMRNGAYILVNLVAYVNKIIKIASLNKCFYFMYLI